MKRYHNKTHRRNLKQRKPKRKMKTRRQRGGISPVNAPSTILSPFEQAQIFLFPLEDNLRNAGYFLDSRTPFLNTANQNY